MATLLQQLQRAKALKSDKLSKDLFRYIRSIEKDLLLLNKQQISIESKDIYGKALGFYSEATEYITTNNALLGKGGTIKRAGDPFTGIDTGDWMKGFYMQEVSGVLRFNSSDPKTNEILSSKSWLSHEVFGLSDQDLKKVVEEKIQPFLIQHFRKSLEI